MSSSTHSEIEKDFENFLNFCKQKNLTAKDFQQIYKPLLSTWRWRFWKRIGSVLFVAIVIWWLCCKVEVLNWSLSALGRLILIELLPFWNWTPLYKAKCLVEKNVPEKVTTASAASSSLGRYETDKMNCVLCEKLESLQTLTNVSYSMIEQNYLEKGLPAVIHDSQRTQSIENILSIILEDSNEYLSSLPCNVETNLVMKQFFSIETALRKISDSSPTDQWFVQFRNCQFDTVKASRKFIKRPYYYPLHFEPFYSSWILMSNNYKAAVEKDLILQGLIFVQQLSGEISITLTPKTPCDKSCLDIEFMLMAGEGLVFSTDLWNFMYKSVGALNAVTTIMEIDWLY